MEHCGDLVAISLLDPGTGEVAAFEELIGSHGGLGGPQTHPMIMHPGRLADRRADRRRGGGLPPDPPLAAQLGIELGPQPANVATASRRPGGGGGNLGRHGPSLGLGVGDR